MSYDKIKSILSTSSIPKLNRLSGGSHSFDEKCSEIKQKILSEECKKFGLELIDDSELIASTYDKTKLNEDQQGVIGILWENGYAARPISEAIKPESTITESVMSNIDLILSQIIDDHPIAELNPDTYKAALFAAFLAGQKPTSKQLPP